MALKIPPSQGGSGCPTNLVEFLSCRNQLSAREELRGPPVTGRLTVNQPWSYISCRGSHGSGMPPPAGLWAEPTYTMELQGCRKSTVKIPLVCRSLFPIVLIPEMPQLPLPSLGLQISREAYSCCCCCCCFNSILILFYKDSISYFGFVITRFDMKG